MFEFDVFTDRRQAGRMLAAELIRLPELRARDAVVLALPRGGVPVGFEIASALDAPLAPFLVRKLGVPGHRELAMGAIASGGIRVLNDDVVTALRIPPEAINRVAAEELAELERREVTYGSGIDASVLAGRTAILVDDGLATGATMRAAVQAVRLIDPRRVIVAVPVGARDTCAALSREADQVLCLRTPEPFDAVGLWYERFDQTTDDEVRDLLRKAEDRLHVQS
jgi:putative phosphoribosyl transferase